MAFVRATLLTATFAVAALADAPGSSVPTGAAAPLLDEVVVTGEHSGPGLWHVHRGQSHVWILGSLSPLPKGITWRSSQVEQLLATTQQVLLPKPFEIGIVHILWLLVTQRDLLMNGGGRRLKDVMPPSLYARFAIERAKYADNSDKWERYRPIIAAAFLQQAAFHQVGLSTRIDLGAAVRMLAQKHGVAIDELKMAGVDDLLDTLKTLPAAAENACVDASLVTVERDLPRLIERARAWATGNVELIAKLKGPSEVDACVTAVEQSTAAIALVRQEWLQRLDRYLSGAQTTLAVVNLDMLLEQGGLLDELRAQGYEIEAPGG